MNKKIIFASHNPGKIAELKILMQSHGITVVSAGELNLQEADETGLTFVENAILKARLVSEQSDLPAIADDSGLVVPALNGAPGIYSARYAGTGKSEDNIQKLLNDMQHLKGSEREAYFHCTLVYLQSAKDPDPLICQAEWHGRILLEPVGQKGFGYDPIFYDPTIKCSAAEMDITTKNHISHRGNALRKLMEQL